jgi:hypothetical protein
VPGSVDRPSILQAEDRAHQGQVFHDNPNALPQHPYVAAAKRVGNRMSPEGSAPQGSGGIAAQPRSFFNPAGLTREVLGFAPYWELSSGGLSDIQYDKLSTVNYFGLTLDGNGNVVGDSGYSGWTSGSLNSLIAQAHAAGDRAVVTFKCFDNPAIYNIIYDGNHSQNSFNNIISALGQKGLDGVNIDFEGSTAGMPSDFQAHFTFWVQGLSEQLRAARPGSFITLDAYSGSASWDAGFMRIDTLAPWVDAFFIMAYDMTMPADAPNAPLQGPYTYNDTTSVDQYLSKVGGDGTKVILGVPYYGYKFSTIGNGFRAPILPGTGGLADTYSIFRSEFVCASGNPDNISLQWDSQSVTPWATWFSPPSGDPCGGNHGATRELYYDDAASLGAKYDLVNGRNIRGTGMWALGYDHGYTDLWNTIGNKLMCSQLQIAALTPASGTAGTQVAITGCGFQRDGSGNIPTVTFAGTSAPVRYVSLTQVVATAPTHSLGAVDVTLTNPAASGGGSVTAPQGFTYAANGYTLDGWGGLHQFGGAPAIADNSHAYWPGWDIARAVAVCPGGQGGYVLDGWGGVHNFGNVPAVADSSHTYWHGWDIARGIALVQCGSTSVQGYVLDGYGGIHAFGSPSPPAEPQPGAYWSGWDIARGIAVCPGSQAGYVLDGWGGVHAFGGAVTVSDSAHAYWSHWDIARSLTVTSCGPGTSTGYTLDGWGGIHAFGSAANVPDNSHAYWKGWDIARGITWVSAYQGGYIVDGWGGIHPFLVGAGLQPDLTPAHYWPYWDIARSIGSG